MTRFTLIDFFWLLAPLHFRSFLSVRSSLLMYRFLQDCSSLPLTGFLMFHGFSLPIFGLFIFCDNSHEFICGILWIRTNAILSYSNNSLPFHGFLLIFGSFLNHGFLSFRDSLSGCGFLINCRSLRSPGFLMTHSSLLSCGYLSI